MRRVLVACTFLLFAVSIAINVLQARRIQGLQDQMDLLRSRGALEAGKSVPTMDVSDATGRSMRLQFGNEPTILYVFSPSCHWCQQNAAAIRALAAQVKGRYHLVGVSLSSAGLEEFEKSEEMQFPVFLPKPESIRAYHLGGTPETIVLGKSGVVINSWRGAYVGGVHDDIEKTLSVKLPEI